MDDSIVSSSEGSVLCDRLAGLSAVDFRFDVSVKTCRCLEQCDSLSFSFCFKSSDSSSADVPSVDVIDLTPYLFYKSESYFSADRFSQFEFREKSVCSSLRLKKLLDQLDENEERPRPPPILSETNELKPIKASGNDTTLLEKYRVEVEQRVRLSCRRSFLISRRSL